MPRNIWAHGVAGLVSIALAVLLAIRILLISFYPSMEKAVEPVGARLREADKEKTKRLREKAERRERRREKLRHPFSC